MKTKTVLFLLFAITFCSFTTDPPSGWDKIYLKGQLDTSNGPDATEAYTDQYNVCVYFYQSVGIVGVSIENSYGVRVYSNEVNTNWEQQLNIPISSFSNGTYTLELSNAFGSAWGEFEKEP